MPQSTAEDETIHATSVAIDGRAIVLRGPSGAGKSDLALRLIDAGAELVADDRTVLTKRNNTLVASAPARLAGRLEVRGIGILDLKYRTEAPVALVVDLVEIDLVPRLPEESRTELKGVDIPHCRIHAFDASTPIKLRMALVHGIGGTE